MLAACLTAAAALPAFLCTPDAEPPTVPATVVITANLNVRSAPPVTAPEPEPEPEPTRTPQRAYGPAADPFEVPEPWYSLAVCESGMNGVPRWDVDTGNGFFGGVQFHPVTWREFGGEEFAPMAHQATPAEQIEVAERVLAVQGWQAWPSCSKKIGLR